MPPLPGYSTPGLSPGQTSQRGGGRYRYLIWRRFCVANSVVDPVPYSEYGSGSTKLLDTDPTRIRIHNTGCKCAALFVDR